MAPPEASQADIAVMRAYLGLDRPWHVQYANFITHAVQGDFGKSVRFRRPAMDLIARALRRHAGARRPRRADRDRRRAAGRRLRGGPARDPARLRRPRLRRARARRCRRSGWDCCSCSSSACMLRLLPTSGRGTPLHVAAARHHAGLVRRGRAHAAHALRRCSTCSAASTSSWRASRGCRERTVDLEARVQERRPAGGDLRRAPVRRAAERLDHRRDRVRLARARPARDRGGGLARLSDRAGGRACA